MGTMHAAMDMGDLVPPTLNQPGNFGMEEPGEAPEAPEMPEMAGGMPEMPQQPPMAPEGPME